jgi:hydroxymethylbilane synthase
VRLRIATRKSLLALTQTRWVAARLRDRWPGLEVEEVHVVTEGDRQQTGLLSKVGGKGLFVSEVEAAIADGRADMAVHSMKDVPARLADGLGLVCVPPREDPRDVLVTTDGAQLDDLEAGQRVGTASLRRACQLRAFRNDLAYAVLRGNVDTRLRKLEEGQYRAIVLAYAGLRRLGLHGRPLWPIPVEVSLPAVGQGVLALEAREDDARTLELLAPLEDEPTRVCVEAERALAALLEGGCQAPLAAHARFEDGGARLRVEGLVGSVDGDRLVRASTDAYLTGDTPGARLRAAIEAGREVASTLLARGADKLLAEARAAALHGAGLLS